MEISINEIKSLVIEVVECEKKDIALSDNLIEMGIIDSLMVMEIIDCIEEKYHMEFPPESIIPDNFETIDKIYRLVAGILSYKDKQSAIDYSEK